MATSGRNTRNRRSRGTTRLQARLRGLERQSESLLQQIREVARLLTAGSAAPMAGLALRSRVRTRAARRR